MNRDESVVAITNRFYECRRHLRRLLGDKYPENCMKWMSLVRCVATSKDVDELGACLILLQDKALEYDGMAQMWICAATVELIELEKAEAVGATG